MTNVIVADLSKTKYYRCEQVYQYNKGMMLQITGIELPAVYEVHFSNSDQGVSKTQIGTSEGVRIPSEYFIPGETIYCWLYLHPTPESSVTEAVIIIPISQRASISDEQPAPEEKSVIAQAVEALNESIAAADGLAEEIPQSIQAALREARDSGAFNGFSPTVTIEEIEGGHNVVFTDVDGDHEFEILNGITPDPRTYPTKSEIPVENGNAAGSVQSKQFEHNGRTYSQTAGAVGSYAEGLDTTANGVASHAEGYSTVASAPGAHAEGNSTIANDDYQHVQGEYNAEDRQKIYADIVGNGVSDQSRSNAFALTRTGNGKFAGDVYVHSDPDSSGGERLARVSEIPNWQSIMLTESDYDTTVGAFVFDAGSGNEIAEARVYGQIVWDDAISDITIAVGFGANSGVGNYNKFSIKTGITSSKRIAIAAEGKNILFASGSANNVRMQYGYGYFGNSNNDAHAINVDAVCSQSMNNKGTCAYWNFNDPRYFSIYAPSGAAWANLYIEYVLR